MSFHRSTLILQCLSDAELPHVHASFRRKGLNREHPVGVRYFLLVSGHRRRVASFVPHIYQAPDSANLRALEALFWRREVIVLIDRGIGLMARQMYGDRHALGTRATPLRCVLPYALYPPEALGPTTEGDNSPSPVDLIGAPMAPRQRTLPVPAESRGNAFRLHQPQLQGPAQVTDPSDGGRWPMRGFARRNRHCRNHESVTSGRWRKDLTNAANGCKIVGFRGFPVFHKWRGIG